MLRFVFRLRVAPAVVFGSALFAGVMLQYDWFQRKPDDAYWIRYGVVAPLTAVALFVFWIGYLRLLRTVVPDAELELAVRRDAWTFLPLLLTVQAIWNPPLTAAIYGWIAALFLLSKVVLSPGPTGRVVVALAQRGIVAPARWLQTAARGLRPRSLADATAQCVGLLLFGYTVTRATQLSFTGDESFSFLSGVRPGLGASLLFQFVDANNHVLNTILMTLSSRFLGSGEFALRLPNLLAHVAYLLATLAIVRRCRSRLLAVAGFILLNLNPFVLDFFSLARGYGLGMAFQMLSLNEALAVWRSGRPPRRLIPAMWLAVLATLANLAFLNYYLALLAWFWLSVLRSGSGGGVRRLIAGSRPVLDQIVVLVATAGFMIHQLDRSGRLYFGGMEGFWTDTVGSLIQRTLYGAPTEPWVEAVMRAGLVLVPATALVLVLLRHARPEVQGALAVLMLAVTSTVLQHRLLGVRYLQGRTALLFFPLFMVLLVLILDHPLRRPLGRPLLPGLAVGLAVILVLHGARTMNLTHSFVWRHDADTRQLIGDLEALHAQTGATRIGVSWPLTPAANYYRVTRDLSWMPPVEREEEAGFVDWYYRIPGPPDDDRGPPGAQNLRRYPISGNSLWSREGG